MGSESSCTDTSAEMLAAIEDGTACWEDTLTEEELDAMVAAGEPVELVGRPESMLRQADFDIQAEDEPVEDVIAAFAAGEKGITAMPDEKRQIVTWLAESGFHAAAEALTEWPGPQPKSMVRRLREAHEMVDWLRHYEVLALVSEGRAISALRCTRHGDESGASTGEEILMLDALVDSAAAHEIAEHGDR